MKVSSNQATAAKSLTSDVEEKLKAKFGKEFSRVKEPIVPKDDAATKVELSGSAKGVVDSTQDDFGDISKNDPSSPETQEKLKGLLRAGGFNFSDKERAVLSQILK